MSAVLRFIKWFRPRQLRPAAQAAPASLQGWRGFADKPKSDAVHKQVVVHGAESEARLRVRRARPADVPRVQRFVREHARAGWPGFAPSPGFHLVLGDYITRILAQGHSMLAEQEEAKRGWNQIQGLAISATVCPWDAALLERWARCVQCKRSRQLLHFTAHCLRAPALHDKYRALRILQVVLIVPPDAPRASEVIQLLAKNTIKRGREVGLPVMRFDVTSDPVAKVLDEMNLRKEWELSYNLLPETVQQELEERKEEDSNTESKDANVNNITEDKPQNKGHFISVYTVTDHTSI